MTKDEFIRGLKISRYPIAVQVAIGKIYDHAYEHGREEGYAQGVRRGAESAMDKLEESYVKGMDDAQKAGSALFLACVSIALHELHGFGVVRIQRVVDRAAHLMTTTLHTDELADKCAEMGVVIDDVDMLRELWTQENQNNGTQNKVESRHE